MYVAPELASLRVRPVSVTPPAVTFDLWNTLLVSQPGGVHVRRDSWESVINNRGLEIPSDLLQSVLEMLPVRFDAEWKAGRQYGAAEAMDDAFAAFGDRVSSADRRALVEAFDRASYELIVEVVDGAIEVLADLVGRGVALGLVSDTSLSAGRHLRSYLKAFGLYDCLGSLAFSDEVGVYKPEPEIFRAALGGLGIDDPVGVIHVGDLRRTDVAGARALGMTTVRFRGVLDDDDEEGGPEADHVIDRLDALPAVLELV